MVVMSELIKKWLNKRSGGDGDEGGGRGLFYFFLEVNMENMNLPFDSICEKVVGIKLVIMKMFCLIKHVFRS